MGLSAREVRRMPWGRLVLMLQARAGNYAKGPEEETSAQDMFKFLSMR